MGSDFSPLVKNAVKEAKKLRSGQDLRQKSQELEIQRAQLLAITETGTCPVCEQDHQLSQAQKTRLSSLEAELTRLNESMAGQKVLTDWQFAWEALQEVPKLDNLLAPESKLIDQEIEINSLSQQIKRIEDELGDFSDEDVLAEKRSKFNALNSSLGRSSGDLERLTRDINDLDAEISDLERILSQNTNENLGSKLASKLAAAQDLNKILDNALTNFGRS